MNLKNINESLLSLSANIDYDGSIAELLESSKPDFAYISLVVLAAFIATLGLITNSTAVIIGAMIISPIMSPIMLSGASFAIMDRSKAKTALISLSIGIVVAILCAMLTVFISPIKENTAEIMARTTPNILDLFIAFFCGVAGALSVVSEKISKGVVGVAISVALMPPLCVGAFGLATMQASIAVGGLWMFFLNMAAIFVATFIVLALFGYSSHFEAKREKHFGTRWIVSIGILIAISIPLALSLNSALSQKREQNEISEQLRKSFNKESISILQKESIQKVGNGYKVDAFIDTTRSYTPQYIKSVEQNISKSIGKKIELRCIQRGVISINSGGKAEFSILDAIKPKIEIKAHEKDTQQKDEQIAFLMKVLDIGEYLYDKKSDTLLIEANIGEIEQLSKLQQKLFEDGIKNSISLKGGITLFEKNKKEIAEPKSIKEMVQISQFALQNQISLLIETPTLKKSDKAIEKTILDIFGQNSVEFQTKKDLNIFCIKVRQKDAPPE